MATSFAVDDETGKKFRAAVMRKYPESYGRIKKEVKEALLNHIQLMKGEK